MTQDKVSSINARRAAIAEAALASRSVHPAGGPNINSADRPDVYVFLRDALARSTAMGKPIIPYLAAVRERAAAKGLDDVVDIVDASVRTNEVQDLLKLEASQEPGHIGPEGVLSPFIAQSANKDSVGRTPQPMGNENGQGLL
jgi:hypothetical protein